MRLQCHVMFKKKMLKSRFQDGTNQFVRWQWLCPFYIFCKSHTFFSFFPLASRCFPSYVFNVNPIHVTAVLYKSEIEPHWTRTSHRWLFHSTVSNYPGHYIYEGVVFALSSGVCCSNHNDRVSVLYLLSQPLHSQTKVQTATRNLKLVSTNRPQLINSISLS